MKAYLVGGAVRDTLLGILPKDRDYVVTGSDPEEMISLGFKPAGKDFPVFLCPKNNDEYALARLERKIGAGYGGFSTDIRNVSLQDDLMRRDLTINAMAMDDDGVLYDPFNGREDLSHKILRHVSDAFAEDPLRVLRVARFLARYGPEWSVAPETLALMKKLGASHEMDAITQERIWLEFSKGLGENHPHLMLSCLAETGLFDRDRYATYRSGSSPDIAALAEAVSRNDSLSVRTVFAFPNLARDIYPSSHRIPSEVREVCNGYSTALKFDIFSYAEFSADERYSAICLLDGFRQTARMDAIARALDCVKPGIFNSILSDIEAAKTIDRTEVIGIEKNGLVIKQLIKDAQILAIERNIQLAPRRHTRP